MDKFFGGFKQLQPGLGRGGGGVLNVFLLILAKTNWQKIAKKCHFYKDWRTKSVIALRSLNTLAKVINKKLFLGEKTIFGGKLLN